MHWLLNLLIPGCGLILSRREWLGFLLALMFGICANIAAAGILIAPDAIPRWLIVIAAVLAAVLWIAGQVFLQRQRAWLRQSGAGIAALVAQARSALAGSDYALARLTLESARQINEHDADVVYLFACLCSAERRDDQARPAWERVLKFDRLEARRAEAAAYLRGVEVPENTSH